MVLGLYYMTKQKLSTTEKVIGEGLTFYSPEEVIITSMTKKLSLTRLSKLKQLIWIKIINSMM